MSDDFRNRLRRELMTAAAAEQERRRRPAWLTWALPAVAAMAVAIAALVLVLPGGAPERERPTGQPKVRLPQGSYSRGRTRLVLSGRSYVIYADRREPEETGTVRASGTILSFSGDSGPCRKAGTGRYAWTLQDDTLRLTLISDGCARRRSRFAQPLSR